MLRRQFVLVPLADLDVCLCVGSARPVGELADRDDPEVRRVGELQDLHGS
jgi:7,8-dihydro-6-hydroxymethylpterin-pyrophosphokinase